MITIVKLFLNKVLENVIKRQRIPNEACFEGLENTRTKMYGEGSIGRVLKGSSVRIIQDREIAHDTEIKSEEDELAGIWAKYPRNDFWKDKDG